MPSPKLERLVLSTQERQVLEGGVAAAQDLASAGVKVADRAGQPESGRIRALAAARG